MKYSLSTQEIEQRESEVKVIFRYTANLELAWATGDPVSEEKKNCTTPLENNEILKSICAHIEGNFLVVMHTQNCSSPDSGKGQVIAHNTTFLTSTVKLCL